MARATVLSGGSQEQGRDEDRQWEEEIYREICALGRERAQKQLAQMEERLFAQHPAEWRVEGFRRRTLMTRFGEVTLRRRLYRDEAGGYRFLLDEHLGLKKNQLATPGVEQAVVESAALSSFRDVSKAMVTLTAGVLSAASVHRLLRGVAKQALAQEEQVTKACFDEGKLAPSGSRRVKRLFIEGDGTWVRLQREDQEHLELKCAIAYEGWQGKDENYRLVGKRVYCHGIADVAFWEGASLAWDRHWDLSRVQQVVIGGDGANWIDEGAALFPGAVRQLDGFHLSRACGRAAGKEIGAQMYQAIREGCFEQAHTKWQSLPVPERSEAKQAWSWLGHLIRDRKGMDWRVQVGEEALGERGLGAMEGNVCHILARRLKGDGQSWTKEGAYAMGKVRELYENDEIALYCHRSSPPSRSTASSASAARSEATPTKTKKRQPKDTGQWLQVNLPVLTGPDSSEPWVRSINQLAHPSLRLN